MKLKFDIEIMEMDDQSIAVPVGDGAEAFHGILKVNDSAAYILNQLKEDTTEEAIVDAILKEYAGNREEIAGFVKNYIAKLRDADLLV